MATAAQQMPYRDDLAGETLWSTYHTLVSEHSDEGKHWRSVLWSCTHLSDCFRSAHPGWMPLIAMAHQLAREPPWGEQQAIHGPGLVDVKGFYTDAMRSNLDDIENRIALSELHVRSQCEGILADMSGAVDIAEEAHEKAIALLVAKSEQDYGPRGMQHLGSCSVEYVIEVLWETVRENKRTPWLRMLQARLHARVKASMDVAHHYHRLRRMLRDAKRARARRDAKKARQLLREYEAPAEDARGAQYTPYEHNVSGLVQMDNVVFQDIVLPHLTAQAAAALRRTCVEFSGLRRQESKGTYLRAMVPQFRVRWLPGKLRAGHQSEGVLPHCKMKSRDGLGRVTLVNAIYSERLVNIVVDFGSWIPRQTTLKPGLRGRLGRRHHGRTELGLAEPHPDPSLAKQNVGVLPADHPLRVAPFAPRYLAGIDEDSDDDNGGQPPGAQRAIARRSRRQKNVRKHWLRHEEATPSQRAALDAKKAFVRVPTNRYFADTPMMFATLVDADTLENVDDAFEAGTRLALSDQRNAGPYSYVNPHAANRWPKYQAYLDAAANRCADAETAAFTRLSRKRNARLFSAPSRIISSRDEDADAVALLPAKLQCCVTPPRRARSHETKGRQYKIAVHIRGMLLDGYDEDTHRGTVYETTVYTDEAFEVLSRKKIVRARGSW